MKTFTEKNLNKNYNDDLYFVHEKTAGENLNTSLIAQSRILRIHITLHLFISHA